MVRNFVTRAAGTSVGTPAIILSARLAIVSRAARDRTDAHVIHAPVSGKAPRADPLKLSASGCFRHPGPASSSLTS